MEDMFGRLLLLFVFLPMIELYLLIMLGARIGPMPTIGLIVLTGVIGATLARQQGLSTLAKIQNELKQGRAPTPVPFSIPRDHARMHMRARVRA